MNKYIRAFVIGSSWLVFIWFFYAVSKYGTEKNYSYKTYTLVAPLFLGSLNVLGLYLATKFNLTKLQRFVMTGLIGAVTVSIFITVTKAYNFENQSRWIRQYANLFLIYLFVYVIVVYILDSLV